MNPGHRYLSLMFLLMPMMVFGQTGGKIAGTVKDARTGEPLIGVNILLVTTSYGASSDLDGSFFILNIPPGRYSVQASLIGYQKVLQTDVIVNSGRTTELHFSLAEENIEVQEVVISAVRPDVEVEKTSTSEIIRSDEILHLAGIRDVGDALVLAADVTDGHFRGGRDGEELYTLQGMGITNPLDNSSAFLPIMSAVEEVEVITSGFSAQYGNAQSGVVNISMKEGRSDGWRTRVESRVRLPQRKHFGPGVFDPSANPYLSFLSNQSVWKGGDDATTRYYTSMADQFSELFGLDTTLRAQVAYTLWRYQTKRDIGSNYGDKVDGSFEAASGGPIDENLRLFVAMRSQDQWPWLPTEEPDRDEQVMGNVVADMSGQSTLRISGAVSRQSRNIFPGANGLGFYNWIWDRLLSLQQRRTTNTQLGARFTQTLSQSTYYELKVNALLTQTLQGSPVAPSWLEDSLVGNPFANFTQMIAGVRPGPDNFGYGNGNDDFREENSQTISVEGTLESQVTSSHLLRSGLQVNLYNLDVRNRSNTRTTQNGMDLTLYTAHPYEVGFYVQDKMEFEGMIANAGLRLDVWAENTRYYVDLFSPYRYFIDDSTSVYDKDRAPQKDTPIIGRLQPRFGVSFPITEETVFHLNYGTFLQRPSFQYVVARGFSQGTGNPTTFGNPRLLPQTTNSYDVGITQGLGDGFTLDLSGYYKDVKNLIQQASYLDRGGEAYDTYVNRDYADIRGFRISLNKRRGDFAGSMNYHYSIATGKSSTPFNASPAYSEETNTGQVTENLEGVPVRDIVLDFDRTHNLIVNLAYRTGDAWGPFDNISLALSSFVRSGRPYTYSPGANLINNKRSPFETSTSLKLSKTIRGLIGTGVTVYGEIFNLFNDRILNYDYIFNQGNANASRNIQAYETLPIDAPNGLRYQNASNAAPFLVDHSFLLYDNSPRSYSLGLVIEF